MGAGNFSELAGKLQGKLGKLGKLYRGAGKPRISPPMNNCDRINFGRKLHKRPLQLTIYILLIDCSRLLLDVDVVRFRRMSGELGRIFPSLMRASGATG